MLLTATLARTGSPGTSAQGAGYNDKEDNQKPLKALRRKRYALCLATPLQY